MSLTAQQIKTRLQIFQGCASLMARNYVYGLRKGKDCSDELCRLNMLLSFIDALKGYQPTSDTADVDATTTFYVWDSVVFKVGQNHIHLYFDQTYLYGEAFEPTNFAEFLTGIVSIFENAGLGITYVSDGPYDLGYKYTFTVTTNCCNNGKVLGVQMDVIDSGTYSDSGEFTGGACYNDAENCITDEQVLNILHKMKMICNDSPLKYIENYQ